MLCARHNLIDDLAETGRFLEAQSLYRETRPLYRNFTDAVTQNRRRWVKGKISLGLGRTEQAERLLLSARDGFIAESLPYDTALVSLELATAVGPELSPLLRQLTVHGVADEYSLFQLADLRLTGLVLTHAARLKDAGKPFVREAAMEALRRHLPNLNLDRGEVPGEVLENIRVERGDFMGALKRVQPSAMREIMIQVPDVGWEDVGGLDQAKELLQEGLELPLRHPEAFRRLGIRPAKGFLLYGPPGTGKTLLAKAAAREAEANFIAAKASDLLSKWYGESEQQIARLFQRARQVAPTVIFIDELDSLAPQRGVGIGEPAVTERVVNTLLAEMDGLEELQGVVVIGATNRPNLLDAALLRPGRFDELIYVSVPSEEGRLRILRIHTQGMPLADDVDLVAIAARTERYTGADLEDIVRRAGLLALRENLDIPTVDMRHFDAAQKETRASVSLEMERDYERISETLKQENPAERRIGFAISRNNGQGEPAAVQVVGRWARCCS